TRGHERRAREQSGGSRRVPRDVSRPTVRAGVGFAARFAGVAMTTMNRRFVLASRPTGAPREDNFRLETVPVPELAPGQVLVRHHYLSLDPYMRGRMTDQKSYATPQPLNEVMIGGTVGEIAASRSERFAVGDQVVGQGGWQEYAVVAGDGDG